MNVRINERIKLEGEAEIPQILFTSLEPLKIILVI